MIFNSIIFLFGFLPLTILLYYLLPAKLRPGLLVIASLLFYAWGSPIGLVYLLISIGFNYLTGFEIAILTKNRKRYKKPLLFVMISSVLANVAMLAYFKYFAGAFPLGISFYTFTVLSYLFDLYQGRAELEKNPIYFMVYVTFFPKLISGPIVQFADMKEQLRNRKHSFANISEGVSLFLCGLMKKVLLADRLGVAFASVTAGAEQSILGAWLGLLFYAFQLYFDFSGYSDMAIGLARMFGFDFAPNFDHPYRSANISEFWRRWHISLGAWFRQYVYIPLGGNRVDRSRLLLNLIIVWVLTGIWHGNTIGFLFWGLFHGFFVILEKFVIQNRFDRIPRFVRILVTDLIVFLGWIFFFEPSVGSAFGYVGNLFGRGGLGFASGGAWFYLKEFALLLIVSVIGSGEFIKRTYRHIFYENRYKLDEGILNLINLAGTAVLLLITISYMVGSTYSTFLYFQF